MTSNITTSETPPSYSPTPSLTCHETMSDLQSPQSPPTHSSSPNAPTLNKSSTLIYPLEALKHELTSPNILLTNQLGYHLDELTYDLSVIVSPSSTITSIVSTLADLELPIQTNPTRVICNLPLEDPYLSYAYTHHTYINSLNFMHFLLSKTFINAKIYIHLPRPDPSTSVHYSLFTNFFTDYLTHKYSYPKIDYVITYIEQYPHIPLIESLHELIDLYFQYYHPQTIPQPSI